MNDGFRKFALGDSFLGDNFFHVFSSAACSEFLGKARRSDSVRVDGNLFGMRCVDFRISRIAAGNFRTTAQ